jgi:LPXTG-site transpeptidase (sortase) family protein
MEIPEDISKVGWYKYRAAPGSNGGSTILVSHRDGVGPEPGAFYKLETLQMGDEVFVSNNNYTIKYSISDIFLIKKSKLFKKSDLIFDDDGAPKLVMITCGGGYDFEKLSYKKNVIVIAKPLAISNTLGYTNKYKTSS